MIDIIGILTRSWLGLHSPAPAPAAPPPKAVISAPIIATPAAGSAAAQAATPSAATTVDNVQKFYANIKQVGAQFKQTVSNSTFGTNKTSTGSVWLMKPGKMRWDYVEKKKNKTQVEKSFISNGKYLYVVEHGNKQVIKKNLQNDLMPVAVTFLYGKGDLKAEFNAEVDKTGKYGAKGDIVLKMTPKKPSAQYKNLYLVVAPDNFRVKQSVIIDSSNNTNQFEFFTPDFEKEMKDTIFEFDERSVKNYRIIDADQQQQGSGSAAPAPAALPPPAK